MKNFADINTCGTASADQNQIAVSDTGAKIAAACGWAQVDTVNDNVRITASGDKTRISATGKFAQITASGNQTQINVSGHWGRVETTGENCVMVCTGRACHARGKVGSWIVLTDWADDGHPTVISAQIDGTTIKADTWYYVENGQLREEGAGV